MRAAALSLGFVILGCHAAPPAPSPAPSLSTASVVPAAAPEQAPAEKRVARNSNGTRKSFPPPAPDIAGKMHVLKYDDFGPQSLAGTLLGEDCYSFGRCCCMEHGDSFEVRVVVYEGVSEDDVRARYPTGPDTGDYRLVRAAEAKGFVTEQLKDLESWPAEDRIPTLEAELRSTRDRLVKAFER